MAIKELEAKDLARLDPDFMGALGNESHVNDNFVESHCDNNPTKLYR